jgi:hypothetical protein
MATTNLYEYIERLRLHLGDVDPDSYRYMDEWLKTALVSAVELLMPRWNYKYILDVNLDTYRNPHSSAFIFPEPPVVEQGDIWPIVIQAAIIIKEGSLENMSWNFASWRDSEISYSNLEGSRSKDRSLQRDIEMLDSMLPWRTKRLAQPKKGHLPGFLRNPYEHD